MTKDDQEILTDHYEILYIIPSSYTKEETKPIDDKVKKLILTDGKEYSLVKFKKEFEVIYQFLLQWLFSLNGKKFDIQKTIKVLVIKTSKNLQKELIQIERGGQRKKFNMIIFKRMSN